MAIAKTLFICIILTLGSMSFTSATNDMVLEPIENMIKKIKNISNNPLDAVQKGEEQDYLNCLEEEENRKTDCCYDQGKKKKVSTLETILLEKTITKIGALLALGFGQAGSEIIAQNMKNNDGGEIDPLIAGKKVMAVYGFCDIRNFTDSTEVLEEEVMIFVNEIAEIVHGITTDHLGSANKNIGDAFLLVWKFDESMCITDEETGDIKLKENDHAVTQMVDLALIAFIKIQKQIHKSYKLDKYRKNPILQKRLDKPTEKYQVKLGFGLHVGWSIEGAIGSSFKIDASYLSSHVNMSSSLEERTKEYGTNLILRYNILL